MRLPSHVLALSGLASALVAAPLGAQLVTPKTVPVHQGDQFSVQPSQREGMADLLIAVDDTLLDPFVNPAKAVRVGRGLLFATPAQHRISDERGGGRTLPIGGYGRVGSWSFAGLVAFQQLDRAGPARWNPLVSEQTAANQYVSAVLGRALAGGWAAGASLQWASLGAVDGVDLLYANSTEIAQSGSNLDLRVGVTREWKARTFELLLLHQAYSMEHAVDFTTWTWDSVRRVTVRRDWSEQNLDRTRTWGLHSEHTRPIGTAGWRVGFLGTVNRLSHPKIPNYSLMNIPRDPGTTYAGNLGIGFARERDGTTVGIDAVLEPITSETWADAAADTSVANGPVIRAGERTVTNRFRFSNARLRLGAGHTFRLRANGDARVVVQGGLGVHSISYRLRQTNHLTRGFRTLDESWIEWGPTVGAQLRLKGLDVLYSYRRVCAIGPCDERDPQFWPVAAADMGRPGGGGIIVAPGAPLTFESGRSTRHAVTLVVPIR